MTIVTTQSELDAAIAAGDNDIRIHSPGNIERIGAVY